MAVKFDISNSNVCAAGGKALAAALNANQVMTELNLACNSLGLVKQFSGADLSGVIAISDAIPTMGALVKFTFGGDAYLDTKQMKMVTPEPATLEVGMTEADLSNKNLGAGGAVIVGAWISHKDNGALTSLDISSNNIGILVSASGWSKPELQNQVHDTPVSF